MIGDHMSDNASSIFRLVRSLKSLYPLKGWRMSVFIASDHHGQNLLGIARYVLRSRRDYSCVPSKQ